jgi:hypothetical protein
LYLFKSPKREPRSPNRFFSQQNPTSITLDIPGGIEKTPTILKRPSREYNAADGFNKLQQLSVRNRDGTVFPGGTSCSTPSTTVTAHDDTKFSKNSNLTASAFVNCEASHYSVSTSEVTNPENRTVKPLIMCNHIVSWGLWRLCWLIYKVPLRGMETAMSVNVGYL